MLPAEDEPAKPPRAVRLEHEEEPLHVAELVELIRVDPRAVQEEAVAALEDGAHASAVPRSPLGETAPSQASQIASM